MATAFFLKGLTKICTGNIDFANDTIKCTLASSSYVPNYTTDEFLDDVTNQLTSFTSPTLTCTIVEDAANNRVEFQVTDFSISSVGTGQNIGVVVLYKDTANAATSPLIGATTGLSLPTNGGQVDIDMNAEGFLVINRTA